MTRLHSQIPQSAILGGVIALWLSGCAGTATAPQNRHVSAADLQFITGLTNIKEFDNQVISDEIHRASDLRVVALAQKIRARVNDFYAKVEPIARRDGISPPERMSLAKQSDMQTRIAAILGKGKYDFDLEFLDDEIAAHRETRESAREALAEPSGDPDLRILLQEGVERLQSNLDALTAMRDLLRREGR